jgi:hypothetical protein
VTVRTAAEWREFWHRRGERELRLLLWAAWDPIGGVPLDEYDAAAARIAALLGSRAAAAALAAELGRIREYELGLDPAPEHDERAAAKIGAWFDGC